MQFERSSTRKLTAEDVQQIRAAYGEGATQGSLARYYGMSVGQIGRIVRGESWKEGAGARGLTPGEQDAMLARLLKVQAQAESTLPPVEKVERVDPFGPDGAWTKHTEQLGARKPPKDPMDELYDEGETK